MDASGLTALMATAAFVGLVHTLTGPDHYLPFVAMARAGNWSLRKALLVTACCGLGHVASSVVLGMVGLVLGAAVTGLVAIEEMRGNAAGWLLLGFGLAYMIWGLRHARRCHSHDPAQPDSATHSHPHAHRGFDSASAMTPWVLFLIFVFGPCEPLIPLLMYPAATSGLASALLVAGVFTVVTLSTMLSVVALSHAGLARFSSDALARYAHASCGGAIAACGATVCLGL